jgi:hypothetical protein
MLFSFPQVRNIRQKILIYLGSEQSFALVMWTEQNTKLPSLMRFNPSVTIDSGIKLDKSWTKIGICRTLNITVIA